MPEDESTPLVEKVNGLIKHENVQQAQDVANEKAKAIRNSFETGNFSLRLLVQIGALALIIFSALGIFNNILHFKFAKSVSEVFTLCLGIIMMILESRLLSLPPTFTQNLLKYALFLKYVWGRGLLYTFAGTLQAIQGSFFDVIVGLYVMAVGVIFILLGYRTAQKLKAVGEKSISTETLREKFNAADKDKSGQLDLDQFSELVDSLEFHLSRREKEIAFLYLDTADRGLLKFEEFVAWFHQEEVAPIL